jgi:hypothetical protein
MTIARPAKKARTGASQPVSGFSTIKQTDQLHSKLLSLNTNSVSNKKDVSTACSSVLSPTVTAVESNETTAKAASTAGLSVACTSVLSPTITAATSNQNTVQPTPTSDLVKQKKLLELLDIPVTAAFESSISSSNRLDSSTTSTAQASFDDILNTPLTLDTLSTPFMFDADLFINSESRNYATDSSTISSSSQNSPICQALSVGQISPSSTRHTSPSSSSDSAGNINDTCFSDISEVYSPPLSVELATSSQANNRKSESFNYDPLITRLLNHFADITQTPPKKVSVSLPGNLALPPVSAAKTVSDTKNATYTMADINNLLNDNEIIEPTTVIANTSNNTTWIQDYDYLFP